LIWSLVSLPLYAGILLWPLVVMPIRSSSDSFKTSGESNGRERFVPALRVARPDKRVNHSAGNCRLKGIIYGQLVNREELQKQLWPDETFVDFEQGINAAVKRLRLALEDSADQPRFIETLARLPFHGAGREWLTTPGSAVH
jgi:hypothetical protein